MSVKAYCESLNILVPLRVLTDENLESLRQSLFVEIKKKSAKPVKVIYYYRWIIQHTLESPDEFFSYISKDPLVLENLAGEEDNSIKKIHVAEELTLSMYQGIIQIYGALDFDIILEQYNKSLFTAKQDPVNQQTTTTNVKITKKFIEDLKTSIKEKLVGQDHAVDSVVNAIKAKGAKLSSFISMFFVGPTGVGKTQLAKLLSASFQNKLIKINCGEMSHGHEHQKYIGSPPGFVGHSEKSYLKEKSLVSSEWIFLFDEIEKASPKFFDFLLSLLDDGTVVANSGETLNFKDSIFIFTSNEGVDQIKYSSLGFGSASVTYGIVEETIKKSLESKFRPEFLNRIDEFITFNSLSEDSIKKIIEIELKKYPITPTEELISMVLAGGYSAKYGVRNVDRFIKTKIKPVLADSILNYGISDEIKYIPIIKDNTISFLRENSHVLDREVQGKETSTKRRKKEASGGNS